MYFFIKLYLLNSLKIILKLTKKRRVLKRPFYFATIDVGVAEIIQAATSRKQANKTKRTDTMTSLDHSNPSCKSLFTTIDIILSYIVYKRYKL